VTLKIAKLSNSKKTTIFQSFSSISLDIYFNHKHLKFNEFSLIIDKKYRSSIFGMKSA